MHQIRDGRVKLRGLLLHLVVLLGLCACGSGSGRQGTEIVVTGTGPTGSVQGGSNAVFVMTVTNAGPYDASTIKLIDNVGNQLKLLSITCAATGGAVCPAAPSVQMDIPSLPNGGSLIFTVTLQLINGATGIVTNSMVASFAEEIDPTRLSAAVTATAFSLLSNAVLGGTGPTGTLVGGSTAVFVMTVTNNGPDATGAFNVFDNVGSGLALTGITCTAAGGAVCPDTVGILTAVDDLPAGGVLTFTVTTIVGQNATGTLTNQLVIDVKSSQTQSGKSVYATVVVANSNLSITGTAPAAPLAGGDAAAFTMVVGNNGPSASESVTLTNTLSANVTASGAITCAAAGGAVCPPVPGSTMTVASIPVAGTLTFTVPFTVNLGASGPITDTLSAASASDPRRIRVVTVGVGSSSSSLVVTESGPPQVNQGGSAVFTVTVENDGPSVATNVNVHYALSGPTVTVFDSVTCNPAPTVSCPQVLGQDMTIPSLGVGRSLTFTYTLAGSHTTDVPGDIVNTVTATAVGNTNTVTNTATASITPVNSHDGTYVAFAADGNQYTLIVNFESQAYSFFLNGQPAVQGKFVFDTASQSYLVGGTARFRLATNLIVGSQDFGGGVIPYVAARSFGSTIQQLASTPGPLYNLVTLSIPASGPTTTIAGEARVSGNTMSICQAQNQNQVAIPQNCGSLPPDSLQSYALSVAGNEYTGTNTADGSSLTFSSFRLAIVGATDVLLSAGLAPDGITKQLVIGLPDAAVLAGGTTSGGSTSGGWITLVLSPTQYSATPLSGGTTTVALQRIANSAGPFSLLTGNGGQLYVMQSYPLTVAFGGYGGSLSGLLQVTVPPPPVVGP